jgi:hypothetical protein
MSLDEKFLTECWGIIEDHMDDESSSIDDFSRNQAIAKYDFIARSKPFQKRSTCV